MGSTRGGQKPSRGRLVLASALTAAFLALGTVTVSLAAAAEPRSPVTITVAEGSDVNPSDLSAELAARPVLAGEPLAVTVRSGSAPRYGVPARLGASQSDVTVFMGIDSWGTRAGVFVGYDHVDQVSSTDGTTALATGLSTGQQARAIRDAVASATANPTRRGSPLLALATASATTGGLAALAWAWWVSARRRRVPAWGETAQAQMAWAEAQALALPLPGSDAQAVLDAARPAQASGTTDSLATGMARAAGLLWELRAREPQARRSPGSTANQVLIHQAFAELLVATADRLSTFQDGESSSEAEDAERTRTQHRAYALAAAARDAEASLSSSVVRWCAQARVAFKLSSGAESPVPVDVSETATAPSGHLPRAQPNGQASGMSTLDGEALCTLALLLPPELRDTPLAPGHQRRDPFTLSAAPAFLRRAGVALAAALICGLALPAFAAAPLSRSLLAAPTGSATVSVDVQGDLPADIAQELPSTVASVRAAIPARLTVQAVPLASARGAKLGADGRLTLPEAERKALLDQARSMVGVGEAGELPIDRAQAVLVVGAVDGRRVLATVGLVSGGLMDARTYLPETLIGAGSARPLASADQVLADLQAAASALGYQDRWLQLSAWRRAVATSDVPAALSVAGASWSLAAVAWAFLIPGPAALARRRTVRKAARSALELQPGGGPVRTAMVEAAHAEANALRHTGLLAASTPAAEANASRLATLTSWLEGPVTHDDGLARWVRGEEEL